MILAFDLVIGLILHSSCAAAVRPVVVSRILILLCPAVGIRTPRSGGSGTKVPRTAMVLVAIFPRAKGR